MTNLIVTSPQKCFGYIRVSTARQGSKGVSLQEQRDAIVRFAERNGLDIAEWFEELETAAKRGRPRFNEMLRRLRNGEVHGLIVHKIDRSARNLKDWSDLGELIDAGIEVFFVNESLDLQTRGGRLSADIQAVVAADYIRNLREEAKKGFYGRLKQGFYPLPAPVGYLNKGRGKPKEIDPVQGPLVRKAFELYGTGRVNLHQLTDTLLKSGLTNAQGKRACLNVVARTLRNPFYIGLIFLKRTKEMFPGAHEPLISKRLFDHVQAIIDGRVNVCTGHHDYLFRKLVTCQGCGYRLIGERQKGHVYYRCHTRTCATTGIREERIDEAVRKTLKLLVFNEKELAYFRARVETLKIEWNKAKAEEHDGFKLRLGKANDRLTRLTDAFLDGAIERTLFDDRKAGLLLERKEIQEAKALSDANPKAIPNRVEEFLELANNAPLSYELAPSENKRKLLKIITSNRELSGKDVAVKLSLPFSEVANRSNSPCGGPYRDEPRTLDALFDSLVEYFKFNDVSKINLEFDGCLSHRNC